MTFPNNTNNRVFYATQAVAVGDIGATGVKDSWDTTDAGDFIGDGYVMVAHGIQSIGVTTNFNLEQIFELGQLSLYENYEEVPDIEVTFEKILDGYSLVYHLGTVDATDPTLTGRSNARSDIRMLIGYDTKTSVSNETAGQSGVAELYCSGTYISSISYNLATDGNFTESTTFVGNNKLWLTGDGSLLADSNGLIADAFDVFDGNDAPVGPGNSVLRRQNLVIDSTGKDYGGTTFRTVVPDFIEGTDPASATGIEGVGGTGLATNCSYVENDVYINSVSISCDLGRESINSLGKKTPYLRYVNFPVEVTCDIEVTATGGDNIDAYEEGNPALTGSRNLKNHSIQFVLDDSTVFSLGNKNKLTSVSYGGGDAGGGNATITYSMSNFNDFVVMHSGDPITLAAGSYYKDWF